MIIVMKKGVSKEEISKIVKEVKKFGLEIHLSIGKEKTIVGMIGNVSAVSPGHFHLFSGVEDVLRVSKPFKLASREFKPEKSVIQINGVSLGGENIPIMAGPLCSGKP